VRCGRRCDPIIGTETEIGDHFSSGRVNGFTSGSWFRRRKRGVLRFAFQIPDLALSVGGLAEYHRPRNGGLIAVVVFYLIKWLPLTPRTALPVLAVQIGAALAAASPVYWLGW
jgi:hypothetical protein